MVFQMMPDAPCVAHAAGRDDDAKAGKPRDRLAFIDRFGRLQQGRAEGVEQFLAILQ